MIDGTLTVEAPTHADWSRIRDLVGRYRDLPLGGTDASLVALDHRHFRVVRPHHVPALTLLP